MAGGGQWNKYGGGRTPGYFWRRKRTKDRVLQPLPALSKRTIPATTLKFWKWPRMPLSHYVAEGPEVPLPVRYGKYASSLTPFARHMLARVGHEDGRHLQLQHIAPTDDWMAGLTIFSNDEWLTDVLTSRVRELSLEATYHVRTSTAVSDSALRQILMPSEPTAEADGLACLGLGVRLPPRPFEVRTASRLLKRFSEEEHDNELLVTVPGDLSATEMRAHVLRTTGLKLVFARCDFFCGLSMHDMHAGGHMAHVTKEEYAFLREREAAQAGRGEGEGVAAPGELTVRA